jgi:hypothetical protein
VISRGASRGTGPSRRKSALPCNSDKALASNNLPNSWGETRTPDPGIMSAVL